jgi:hypothetical protein
MAGKKRKTPFNEKHTLEYGLQVYGRSATGTVDSVVCRFCTTFEREGKGRGGKKKNDNEEWKRDITLNAKYFTAPFRAEYYRSHLKCHAEKWKEYCHCSTEEKRKFFDVPNPSANSLHAHFDITKTGEPLVLFFDADIVESLIGDMLFDAETTEDDDDDTPTSTREQALAIFKQSGEGYKVEIKNRMQYRLTIKLIGNALSFKQIVNAFRDFKEETHKACIGSVPLGKAIFFCRVMLASSLQNIKDSLKEVFCYSVAFDSATYQNTSYFDIRLRVYKNGDVHNIHVLALPMFERHTGDYMFQLFQRLFDTLDPSWKNKLIGVTSDGARSMTGLERGVVTRIQSEVLQQGFTGFGAYYIN